MSGSTRIPAVGRVVNLLIPGGGLIMVGNEILGVLVAVLFTASASYAIAAWLLFPDDTTGAWRSLILGIALGTYVGSQIRYAQTVRHQRDLSAAAIRRSALRDCQVAMRENRLDDAWNAISRVATLADVDLAVAYRIAQVQSARGDEAEARRAWTRLRRLDRHRIYWAEFTAAERALDAGGQPGKAGNPQDLLGA